jgi:hypothetical protein
LNAVGSGIWEEDIINYPDFYLYDRGLWIEDPIKGELKYNGH